MNKDDLKAAGEFSLLAVDNWHDSIFNVAVNLGVSPVELVTMATSLGIKPTQVLNGSPYLSAADAERLAQSIAALRRGGQN